MSRTRSFCFTSYDLSEEAIALLNDLPATYLIYGKELCPSTFREHLQGYMYFANKKAFKAVLKLLPKGSHLEATKGTAVQNIVYCKKDGDYVERGTPPQQGRRNDIEGFTESIKRKATDLELIEEHARLVCKYPKYINFVRKAQLAADRTFEALEVLIFWGDAGTGKTRKAYEIDPDLYHFDYQAGYWFDGYLGQETILLDDFYGGIKHGTLLKLLDGYKFQLPVKGGFTWKSWKRVVLTSNADPRTWYKELGMTPAFRRRITKIVHFSELDQRLGASITPQPLGAFIQQDESGPLSVTTQECLNAQEQAPQVTARNDESQDVGEDFIKDLGLLDNLV